MTDKSKEAHSAKNRPERKPLVRRQLLDLVPRPGYVRRFVNEEIGAVDAFLAAGWTFVNNNGDDISYKDAKDAELSGSIIRRVVNQDPHARTATAVAMEIPEEFYKADVAARHQRIDEQESSYNKTKNEPGFYGESLTQSYI